ncbi:hypothetical protein FF1_006027 [Malus domestica]
MGSFDNKVETLLKAALRLVHSADARIRPVIDVTSIGCGDNSSSVICALAIIVANPTDLVKVRLQAEGKLPAGVPKRYTGSLDAYSTIVRQEGLGALWTGLGPNVARNAIINAAELASYDQVKETILKIPGSIDNILTHLLAGLGADFFAVSIGSPVDVVKSRMMGDSTYKNTFDCFVKTLKHEGFLAFYKGFLPNFGRLGSWNVVMFLVLEQAKNVFRV